jgi:cellobiose phosphorylase
VHHLLGVRPDQDRVTIRPHLLEGLDRMEASLRVRECKLDLSVRRASSLAERGGRAGSERLPWQKDGVRLPLPKDDLQIEILC